MRVLLTGAAGFVGRVALDLLRARHEVTPFDVRPVEGCDDAIVGDVLDYDAVSVAMEGCDAVVNTIMAPNASYGDNGPGFTINVSGITLLEAAHTHGIKRFVHTSSGAVHTGYPLPPETRLTHDLYPLKAAGPYALSKVLQEEAGAQRARAAWPVDCRHPSLGHHRLRAHGDTDGASVTGFYFGSIDRRDVASLCVRAGGRRYWLRVLLRYGLLVATK